MKKLLCLFSVISFASCMSIKVIPLSGTYPTTPIVFYSDKSFDKVWDNIIDMFAQKGISIRVIDRASGLIVSDKSKLSWTFEDFKNGKNKKDRHIKFDKDAFVVLEQMIDPWRKRPFTPDPVTGDWNVRIKKDGDRTSINVNLNNITATYERDYYTQNHLTFAAIEVKGKTTGVFEKMIFDIVK